MNRKFFNIIFFLYKKAKKIIKIIPYILYLERINGISTSRRPFSGKFTFVVEFWIGNDVVPFTTFLGLLFSQISVIVSRKHINWPVFGNTVSEDLFLFNSPYAVDINTLLVFCRVLLFIILEKLVKYNKFKWA